MPYKQHSVRIVRAIAATALFAASLAPLPMTYPAQAQGTRYHHCKTSSGPVGPNYLIPPNVSRAGLYCFESFWSLQEAIGRVCYFTSLRRDMIWPQMTDPVPDYGIRIACK